MNSIDFRAVEHRVGKKPFYEDPQPSKSDPGHQRQPDYNSAKNDGIEEKICQIVLLGHVGVFVPRDVSLVADRSQQRSRFAFRQRTSRDHDDRAGACVEERADIDNGRNARLLLRHLMRSVDLLSTFR